MRNASGTRTSQRFIRGATAASVVCISAAIALSRPGGSPGLPCFRFSGLAVCCADHEIQCGSGETTWNCPQDSDEFGYMVTLVTEGSPGMTQKLQTHAGDCNIHRTTCGSTPNSCDDVATPIHRHCYNTIPSGADC